MNVWYVFFTLYWTWSFPSVSSGKEPACQRRTKNAGSIPGSARSPGGGHGNRLQCSSLENPRDREAWWATVHGFTRGGQYWSNLTGSLNLIRKDTLLTDLATRWHWSAFGNCQLSEGEKNTLLKNITLFLTNKLLSLWWVFNVNKYLIFLEQP